MTPEQEAKLPRYVQVELYKLRANLASARAKLRTIETGKSDTWIESLDTDTRRHRYDGLVPGSTIVFGPNPDSRQSRVLGVKAHWVPAEKRGARFLDPVEIPGHLDLWADNQIAVRPLSGNRIAVFPISYSSGMIG